MTMPGTSDPTSIRFLFGGRVSALADVDPNMTVLQWLRTRAGRTGTKEGCAEGDCGACTVVLGELADGKIGYRAANACILFMPALDGRQLLTIEDLRAPDGALHPVQQAMVESHASQCGFCTPGFAMALYALYRTDPAPDDGAIADALAGNLCRCTGYRPIIDAARQMYALGAGAQEDDADTVAALAGLARERGLAYHYGGRRWFAPVTGDELADLLLAEPDACIVAGGTDVGLWVTKQQRDLDTIIYLGNLAELKRVERADGWIEIGAAAPCSDAMAVIAAEYPAFGELLRRFGSTQIRNAGTLGGNVANGSPIGDSMPALIALGASIVLRRGAARREVPLDAFYLGYRQTALTPGEFVERIRLPVATSDKKFATYKISKRFDQDISAVSAAYCLEMAGDRVARARICYGGMAAVPKRAGHCEAALAGQPWSGLGSGPGLDAAAAALARDFDPIADMRAGADYRRLVAQNLLRKFWLETAGGAGPLDLASFGRSGP